MASTRVNAPEKKQIWFRRDATPSYATWRVRCERGLSLQAFHILKCNDNSCDSKRNGGGKLQLLFNQQNRLTRLLAMSRRVRLRRHFVQHPCQSLCWTCWSDLLSHCSLRDRYSLHTPICLCNGIRLTKQYRRRLYEGRHVVIKAGPGLCHCHYRSLAMRFCRKYLGLRHSLPATVMLSMGVPQDWAEQLCTLN